MHFSASASSRISMETLIFRDGGVYTTLQRPSSPPDRDQEIWVKGYHQSSSKYNERLIRLPRNGDSRLYKA